MGFFANLFSSDKSSNAPTTYAPTEDIDGFKITANNGAQILAEIDIEAAISAHENWKLRLGSYVAGTSQEALRPEVVCMDDQCLLGKWLHGSGRSSLGRHQSFEMLVGRHKQFHIEASNVIALTQASQLGRAQEVMNGNYARASRQVIWLLKNLKDNLDFLKH
jgi:hypothetical protein